MPKTKDPPSEVDVNKIVWSSTPTKYEGAMSIFHCYYSRCGNYRVDMLVDKVDAREVMYAASWKNGKMWDTIQTDRIKGKGYPAYYDSLDDGFCVAEGFHRRKYGLEEVKSNKEAVLAQNAPECPQKRSRGKVLPPVREDPPNASLTPSSPEKGHVEKEPSLNDALIRALQGKSHSPVSKEWIVNILTVQFPLLNIKALSAQVTLILLKMKSDKKHPVQKSEKGYWIE